jgi:hypothetical protein
MKTDDFIEDVESLIKQYNLDSDSIGELKWVSERRQEAEDKIEFYRARIDACEILIKMYDAAKNDILKTKNKES